ncbi:NAD(P)H-binding protein [Kineococcus rubinsiae]|uniref:NAD(P)H-binding protein n=1 Tax=Kineococcus rubinsiae TaxID=2609562 RepID=UPI0014305A46|nr:NAD(P)H-binding protein [Kineococcus rubinsiae]NIZ90969.1 NAD(P)H-binding protein [Kineococcus rubinsiae]
MIVVTGATGKFGRLAVEALLRRGTAPQDVVATGRATGSLADLAERGVTVRPASYDDPASLRAAFAGADRLLFVSGSEVGRRVPQHEAVVAAAAAEGVGLVAYTSIVRADTSSLGLAAEHVATERALAASGLPHVLLRNGWYVENYDLAGAVEHGLRGASGEGRFSLATRADYAEAAAVAVSSNGQEGRVHELGGVGVTMTELAAEISRQSGADVRYTDSTPAEYETFLVGVGLPAPLAASLADADRGAGQGDLLVDPHDLEALLGRPATTVAEAVRAALAVRV